MMNLENTKVYTTDEEVIRKYCELCGKQFAGFNHDRVGVFNGNHYVKGFSELSCIDVEPKYTPLPVEQINALYAEKFGIKTETPEESEALDAIAQVDSEEWKNGDECVTGSGAKIYIAPYPFEEGMHILADKECVHRAHISVIKKPETQQQREERERLERGEEMYIQHCKNMGADKFYWNEKNAASKEAWCKLAEQYRKESK